jgi:glutathione S-transferase
MYKLYNVKGWGSMCGHFLLEEMAVPYTNIWMTSGQVREPSFRDLGPLGLIPCLGLPDGRTLFESGAIVAFLASAHPETGMAPPPGSHGFGEFLSWLHFMSTNLYVAINHALGENPFNVSAAENASIVKGAALKCDELWAILATRLSRGGPWLMGKDFSALDIYMFMLTIWARPSEAALHEKLPRIAQHAAAVRARPKLKAALDSHGVLDIGGY